MVKAFILAFLFVGFLSPGLAAGDEAPIAGTVKAIDASARTLTLQTTARGKTREVMIFLRPDSKIVKFVRAAEPGNTGFVEKPLTLADPKPGWIVSVTTRHEGDNEVADVVKVVLER